MSDEHSDCFWFHILDGLPLPFLMGLAVVLFGLWLAGVKT